MTNSELSIFLGEYIKKNLSPTKQERDDVSTKYDQLQRFIGGTTIQSGSYARFTSTTPVNDLDVIWIIPEQFVSQYAVRSANGTINPQHVDPTRILSSLATLLEESYKKASTYVRIKPQSHSIGLYFGTKDDEFSMDIVPAILTGEKNSYGDDTYWVPQIATLSKGKRASVYSEHKPIDWIKSDPRGYIADAKEVNDSNPNFRKVAKFARKWRRGCKSQDDSFPLKSFHLELIVNDIFCEIEGIGVYEAIKNFFIKLPYYLKQPNFADRADSTTYVDSYINDISDADRAKVITQINKVHTYLSSMEVETSEDKIKVYVEQILSGRLPAADLATVNLNAGLITLGDCSHYRNLSSVGIIDQPTYPCTVTVKAQLMFKGPKDKKINRRPRGSFPSGSLIPTWHEIDFTAKTDAPVPYRVFWQVVNTGEHAKNNNDLRGSFYEGGLITTEHSMYTGMHWIECFIVTKEDVCIARSGKFYVKFLNPYFPLALA
jgi:hypothetical protein